MKIDRARIIFLSLNIINKERKMSINVIIVLMIVNNFGRSNIKIGEMNRVANMAKIEPYKVRINASWALPSSKSLWPGRIERKDSSSGAPRYIDGMKSIKVWVIDIETIKIAIEIGGIDDKYVKEPRIIAETRLI